MTSINWILQTNLVKPELLAAIRKALEMDNITYQEVKIVPFSHILPAFPRKNVLPVFYGSETLIKNAYRDKTLARGVFYDHRTFNIENYMHHWGTRMLNHDSIITTFPAFATRLYDEDSEWFLRPNDDSKAFSGRVMRFSDIQKLAAELNDLDNPALSGETRIVVSSPKSIVKEWRHFIVNGKVIDTCRYACFGEPDADRNDVPEQLLRFVEETCAIYSPHDIFVMDTALCNGVYTIVECNCFNGTGFYDHDVVKIIRAVNAYLAKRPTMA